MEVRIWVELVVTILFFVSMVVLNFATFKINIGRNHKQILSLSLIVGAVNYYFKFVMESSYFLISQVLVYIICLVVFRRYPVLYAFIFGITGSIGVSLIDSIVTITALQTGASTMDLMTNDLLHFVVIHLITTTLCVLLAFALRKFNRGFAFVSDRFTGKQALKTSNFVWTTILALGFLILEFANTRFTIYSSHAYIIVFIFLSLLVSIIYTFKQNEKLIKELLGDRYEEFKNRKHR